MNFILIFLISAAIFYTVAAYSQRQCGLVNFSYRTYEKEVLLEGLTRPFHLSYNEGKGLLMFHEDTDTLKFTKTYILDVETKKVTEVERVQHAMGSVAHGDDFLVGSNNGLYKYDTKEKNITLYNLEGTTFYNVYIYNNKIYYIDYPKKDLYVINNNNLPSVVFTNFKIEAFALDSSDNYYFGNVTGWYYGNLGTKTNDFIAQSDEVPYDNFVVNPTNEIVYATSHYGVFKISRDYGNFKRISTKAMLDLIFESDGNIIYSDEEHIVRLKPTNRSCP